MRIVLTLLARNEEDVLEANLTFHRNQGVDLVIVTDNRSVDGTRSILERGAREGFVHVIDEPGDNFDQERWVTRMARMAHTDFGADWVLNGDADEFFCPTSGDLRTTLAAIPALYGVVAGHRRNFPCTPDDGRPFYERMTVRDVVSLSPIGGHEILPKLAHRGHPALRVRTGGHNIADVPFSADPRWDHFTVLHYPVRNYAQFERKIVAGGRAIERNPEFTDRLGRRWREYYKASLEGRLGEIYENQLLTLETAAVGIREGTLVEDRRVLEALRRPPASVRSQSI